MSIGYPHVEKTMGVSTKKQTFFWRVPVNSVVVDWVHYWDPLISEKSAHREFPTLSLKSLNPKPERPEPFRGGQWQPALHLLASMPHAFLASAVWQLEFPQHLGSIGLGLRVLRLRV